MHIQIYTGYACMKGPINTYIHIDISYNLTIVVVDDDDDEEDEDEDEDKDDDELLLVSYVKFLILVSIRKCTQIPYST